MTAWRELMPTCASCLFLVRRRTVAFEAVCTGQLGVVVGAAAAHAVHGQIPATQQACADYLNEETLETLVQYLRRVQAEQAEGAPYR